MNTGSNSWLHLGSFTYRPGFKFPGPSYVHFLPSLGQVEPAKGTLRKDRGSSGCIVTVTRGSDSGLGLRALAEVKGDCGFCVCELLSPPLSVSH
uniref:Uncharacterized protein n=1 Tax=Knipowitschia caucasica TaxID=637954 RepID=A0AAV2M4U8_KNICA